MKSLTAVFLVIYISAIVLANYLVSHFGLIPVGFGLMAPAGVYAAGLTFPCRDYIQRTAGKWWGIAAIIAGAGISWFISPTLAVASGVTFLCSETADMLIYTPLQRRFSWAVIVSSAIAAVVDSLIFLRLAHIPYSLALAGQIVGKLEVIVLVGLPVTVAVRRWLT